MFIFIILSDETQFSISKDQFKAKIGAKKCDREIELFSDVLKCDFRKTRLSKLSDCFFKYVV